MTNDITNASAVVIGIHPNVSTLKTSNYTIVSSDYFIGVGMLTAPITITLPASPSAGDQYVVKDVDGYAGTYPITIDGYGLNIDATSSIKIAQSYASYTLTYTGSRWSISVGYAGNQNGNGYGVYANRPAQGQSGRTYYAIDQSVFYYDNGIAWNAIGPQINAVSLPLVSDFTWVNQSGSIATDTGSGIYLQSLGINSGSVNSRMLVKSMPSTPFSINVCIQYAGITNFGTSNGPVGLCFRESSSGALHTFTIDFNSGGDCVMSSTKYNSPTSINAVYSAAISDYVAGVIWLQISNTGTNRYCGYSRDGVNYNNFHIIGSNDFITPDQVGIFMDPIFQDIKMTITSWIQV